ncbi:YhcN/YlaJ family sporulation lipoprotein [Paenibacillus methanolicus]|uniref:YhcN/YlaJ family sporulation lipoprotein n=1 Tax=Paenibacillus methanolicus TaxID=582686 RepID=A0A5S5BUA0_9BACL|nr:YhcN/YlaJ family sporulation lipoprotein [Paenibacillus methanolicus]TYP69876.1 YhcN/YlaJ family sporulation lipoprotein [Paenibacillus methanolicus]
MQRKWLLLAAGAMFSTVIVGCSDNHGELGNRNIRQQSVREDGNGNMHVRFFANDQLNEQNRMNGRRLNSNNIIGSHRNYRLELDTNIAERLSSLSGVGTAYVMLTNSNAYVAIDGKESRGMSAKSIGQSSMRPLSRTDMAYLPPSAHARTEDRTRAYAHPFGDTMGNSNFSGMTQSTRASRFDGRKSYDSTKFSRQSVNRMGVRAKTSGTMNTVGPRTYAHTFRDAMGLSNYAEMLQSTGELNRIGDRMQYDAMNNKNVANDRAVGMRSAATGTPSNGAGVVRNDRESTMEAQMERGRRMNSRAMDIMRDRSRFTHPAQRGNTTSGATTVRPYGGELGRGMSIGYQNSIDYDMYGGGGRGSMRPMAMTGAGAVRIDGQLQARIEREVKRMAPSVNHVYVSSNPDFVHRMAAYAEDVRLGHPIQGYITEFNAMAERVFPARAIRNR